MKAVCLNKSCDCETTPDSNYCCETCHAADQANPQVADCSCGHPGCSAGAGG